MEYPPEVVATADQLFAESKHPDDTWDSALLLAMYIHGYVNADPIKEVEFMVKHVWADEL